MSDDAQHSSTVDAEHFVTLFDLQFLSLGISLYRSLLKHYPVAELWVVCLDEKVEFALRKLRLPKLHLIPLKTIESAELLEVKPTRSRAEYCWTLTPFTVEAVFSRNDFVRRVTYLDADLYFLDSPASFFVELETHKKQILISEHAYAPEYDQTETSGRFCVQFLTFSRDPAALEVAHWWQARCLECCSEVPVDGKFGDQKYLDDWPTLFGDVVHVAQKTEKTIAPWNVGHQLEKRNGPLDPVFYHFHGLRLYQGGYCRLYSGYQIPNEALYLYDIYLASLTESFQLLSGQGIQVSYPKRNRSPKELARLFKRKWYKTEAWRHLETASF
ncbi:hypothetical protein Pla110_05210 [Polystyrenella longa]|uniref:Glycosyl transferase family 8 n=1 Tax=Polystyrenella longa TaxID=2528007 RepID=A0A518CHX5_9PLAN|nr:glycosyl transferase [Polystyrenella longa]QDU78817.1 hypothetical protein Pla110_05210 [Polystyrenella longa]